MVDEKNDRIATKKLTRLMNANFYPGDLHITLTYIARSADGQAQHRKDRGMKKLWKKVTPIPPEMNGYGYLWDCTKCGYCLTSTAEYPKCKCPKCGASEVEE